MHISFFRLPPTMVGFLSGIYSWLSPFFLDHNFLVLSIQPLPFPALKRFMYPRLLSLPICLNLKSYSYIPLDFSDWTIIYIFQLLKSQNFQLAWPRYTEFFSCSLNIFKNLFFFLLPFQYILFDKNLLKYVCPFRSATGFSSRFYCFLDPLVVQWLRTSLPVQET